MNDKQIINGLDLLIKQAQQLACKISLLIARKRTSDENDQIRWYAHAYKTSSDRKEVTDRR